MAQNSVISKTVLSKQYSACSSFAMKKSKVDVSDRSNIFRIVLIFFLLGEGAGESKAPGGEIGFYSKSQGVSRGGRGRGAGRVSAEKWEIWGVG